MNFSFNRLFSRKNKQVSVSTFSLSKTALLSLCFLVALLFTSCDEENYYHPGFLMGNWVSVSNSKEPSLILSFDEDEVEVKNSAYCYRPFTSDDTWYYTFSNDSVLTLFRDTDDDSFDLFNSDILSFDLYLFENGRKMTLVYHPILGESRSLSFLHR